MNDIERPRSIRFPQWLWDEIDREALRCKRSAVKQMEVVLAAYYRQDNANIDTSKIDKIAEREVPVINIPLSPDIGEKPRQRKKA